MEVGTFLVIRSKVEIDTPGRISEFATLDEARGAIERGDEGAYCIARVVDSATKESVIQTTFAKRRRARKVAAPIKKKGVKPTESEKERS